MHNSKYFFRELSGNCRAVRPTPNKDNPKMDTPPLKIKWGIVGQYRYSPYIFFNAWRIFKPSTRKTSDFWRFLEEFSWKKFIFGKSHGIKENVSKKFILGKNCVYLPYCTMYRHFKKACWDIRGAIRCKSDRQHTNKSRWKFVVCSYSDIALLEVSGKLWLLPILRQFKI